MSDQAEQGTATAAGSAHAGREGLRANAIGLKDAIIVGMASSGPTASIALTLAAIVGAMHYGGPVAVLGGALPMFGVALAYRRLDHRHVDCGGSYTWGGGAITAYLAFMAGRFIVLR